MAEAVLNEEQKALLARLRRKMGFRSDQEHREEDLRFYNVLSDFVPEEAGRKENSTQQKEGDRNALLRELKAYVLRIGPEDDLYDDALDVLQTIAPEAMGEAKKTAEQAEVQRRKEMEQMVKITQERQKERMDEVSARWFHYEDKDGNFIPDDVDEKLKNKAEKKDEKQNRRKMDPEEVNLLMKGDAKEKHQPEKTPEKTENVKKKTAGPIL